MPRKRKWDIVLVIGFILSALVFGTGSREAQATSFNKFTILVLGDSLGVGLFSGFHFIFGDDPYVNLVKKAKIGSGLYNTKMGEWKQDMLQDIEMYYPNVIAVVLTGGNDPQPIRYAGRKRTAFRSKGWYEMYSERVGEYMSFLVQHGVPTFWMGLPAMRDEGYDKDIQYLNEIYRAIAVETGAVYIETRPLTLDENGKYSTYLKDRKGRMSKIRAQDGKHFTRTGYELLAHHALDAVEYTLPKVSFSSVRD